MSTDMQEAILAHLPPQYPWRDQLIWLPETGSTNEQLKALARQGAPHGTAVLAGSQTSGKGRLGRRFLSPPGTGVYLSLLLRPECTIGELMHLTCAAGVAMCDALEAVCGIRPGIKWINDLVYGKRKLGGILTELGFTPQGSLDYAIVGIGINCCQQAADFAPEIREMAGSLAMAAGAAPDPAAVAAAMLEALQKMSEDLLSCKSAILAQYRKDCVTLGQEVSLLQGGETRHALALDVDENGALRVCFPDGHEETVNAGEASVRGMYGYV